VWRCSNRIISNKTVKINKEKTIKLKREAQQPKIKVKVHSNINSKIISSNNSIFKVMKYQDQAQIKQLKTQTKQLQTHLLQTHKTKTTVALTMPTIK